MYVIYACNIYREFIKDFRATKKIGVLRKFTVSGDRESRDGEHFAGIIFSLLFPYAENKNGEQAGKQNDRAHIIYDFYLSISDAN